MRKLFGLEKIVHAFSQTDTVLFEPPASGSSPIDVYFCAPYNEKIQLLGRRMLSAPGFEIDDQPAENRFPHEGEPASKRAQDSGPLGAAENLRPHPRGPQGSAALRPA